MVGMTLQTREGGQAALLGASSHPDTTSLHFPRSEAALLLIAEPDRETPAHAGTQRTSSLLTSRGSSETKTGLFVVMSCVFITCSAPEWPWSTPSSNTFPQDLWSFRLTRWLMGSTLAPSAPSLLCAINCSWEPPPCFQHLKWETNAFKLSDELTV